MASPLDLDLSLQPKQEHFLRLLLAMGPDVATWLAFGGARGGAKSATVRRCALILAGMFDGITVAIIRRTFPDVNENHIEPMLKDFPSIRQYYKSTNHEIVLPNGSRVVFRYAETAKDINRKFWGPEFAFILVDQAEQFSGEELQLIKTANRWPGKEAGFCKTALFFNPGGIGTEYLRRVFKLKQYQDQERSTDFAFVQAYGWDNYEWFRNEVDLSINEFYALPNEVRFELFINHTSEGRKLNSLPASLRSGHLLGSFDSFAGQYYAGVWDESKCILSIDQTQQLIQPWWVRWTATDWGFAHYAAHGWFASGKVSPKQLREVLDIKSGHPIDVVVAYRELVINNTPEADLGRMMVDLTPEAERKHISRHWMSPDAFATGRAMNTIAQTIGDVTNAAHLPRPEPADNDRIGGWRLLYDGFRQTCAVRSADFESAPDLPGGPMLMISGACPQIIASFPLLIRDEKKLEDVLKIPGALADDVGDMVRYGYKSQLDPHSTAPRAVRAQEVYNSIQGDDADAMTSRHLAMQQFYAAEKRKTRVGPKRWRQ